MVVPRHLLLLVGLATLLQHVTVVRAAVAQPRRALQSLAAADPYCSDLATRTAAVNAECCDEASEDCSSGRPATCSLGCARQLLPFYDDCATADSEDSLANANKLKDVVALCKQALEAEQPALVHCLIRGDDIFCPPAEPAVVGSTRCPCLGDGISSGSCLMPILIEGSFSWKMSYAAQQGCTLAGGPLMVPGQTPGQIAASSGTWVNADGSALSASANLVQAMHCPASMQAGEPPTVNTCFFPPTSWGDNSDRLPEGEVNHMDGTRAWGDCYIPQTKAVGSTESAHAVEQLPAI